MKGWSFNYLLKVKSGSPETFLVFYGGKRKNLVFLGFLKRTRIKKQKKMRFSKGFQQKKDCDPAFRFALRRRFDERSAWCRPGLDEGKRGSKRRMGIQ